MKKFYILFFFYLVNYSFAQKILNTSVSGASTVTDKVSITMKPGFEVKLSSGTVFRAFIDSNGSGIPDYQEEYYPSLGENYIRTIECLDTSCSEKKETIVYYDGLGREKQALQVAGSPTGKTIVIPFEYDGFGRQVKEFLPIPTSSAGSKIRTNVDGTSFYSALTGDTTPYSEKVLENSPLNRVLKQAAPGNSWKVGSGHEAKFDYQTNAASEVLRFDVSLSSDYSAKLVHNGYYNSSSLYKMIMTDENGQSTQEFKDKEGRIILKRTSIPAIEGNSSGNHDTYYVYDVYGNLTYVLPPKLIEVGDYVNNLAELGYQYQYDEKNRLVEKQLPGKGREYLVYDKQDRLVATQNALQREKGSVYTYIQYDKFGRLATQGQHPEPGISRIELQNYVNSLGKNNVERTINPYHHSGLAIYYTNTNVYGGNQPNSIFTTVNYYDNYENLGIAPSSLLNHDLLGIYELKTRGLPVATFSNVLGTSTWNKDYIFYDRAYVRPVASYRETYLGGYQKIASNFDFRGKITNSITKHKRSNTSDEITIKEGFSYYENELLHTHTHQVNHNPVEYLTQNSYNEINQLTTKKVGSNDISTPLQTIDYKYNIRGWLTGINDVDKFQEGKHKDLFDLRINYDKPYYTANKLYNGNISEVLWKTASDRRTLGYMYNYDGLNRLMNGVFINPSSRVHYTYNESIKGYDKNGNILGIYRNGGKVDRLTPIDDLAYSYQPNTNKLLGVTDAVAEPLGFADKNKQGNDYAYDINGNLVQDLNKGITKISYNYLNLPVEVLWNDSKKINYSYDASGVKLRKVVTDGGAVATTDYLDGFQYQNNVLQFFPTSEGYVNATSERSFSYVYNYTDHLGNIRLSYEKQQDGALKILEENNYYPFGLKHSGYTATTLGNRVYNYKYQGQELQDELSLNWYSFKWRNYDPAIGRFFNVDPLSEKYAYQSHYNFSENRVIDAFELEGLEAVTLKTMLELGNSNSKGLQAVRSNREYINNAASHYGVSAQAIGSIIFQEKSAGIRGDLANALSKGFIKNGTTSLGLGEIQVYKVAELRGLDANKDYDKIVDMLEDPKTNINLIAENIADMQNFVGKELSVSEITYGHNAGKENLKSQLSKGGATSNRVSSRSSNMQGAIKDALKGKNDERSDKQRDADNTVKKDPLQYRGFYENRGSKL